MDVHNLVKNTPDSFYEHLFKHFQIDPNLKTDVLTLKSQLERTLKGQNDWLNYLSRSDFDLSVFDGTNIDLVVSNSAFQQFDDPAKTIKQLSEIVRPGALFIALIDMKTHTRWINKRDPLNIYRYADVLYNPLKFRGSQNRIRPLEYKQQLEAFGWENVEVIPRIQLEQKHMDSVLRSLQPKFQSPECQMDILTCIICARKS
ncbi:MAG: SAM-dependent methyltransferase [Saprospiraceae bacterium]|jgi:SAM-dependent methyltransferase